VSSSLLRAGTPLTPQFTLYLQCNTSLSFPLILPLCSFGLFIRFVHSVLLVVSADDLARQLRRQQEEEDALALAPPLPLVPQVPVERELVTGPLVYVIDIKRHILKVTSPLFFSFFFLFSFF